MTKTILSILVPLFAVGMAAGSASKPNIVFVYFDDMGYGDVSCLNSESKIQTPNIDRMAAEGMTFTDAHAPAAVCTPSRYGVLTGRYPWRSRRKSSVCSTFSPPLIRQEQITVAEMMRDNGYTTGHVGKWHLGNGWQLKSGGDYEAAHNETRKKKNKFADPGVDFNKPILDGANQHGFDYSITANATIYENGIPQGEVTVVKPNSKNGYRDLQLNREELVPLWVEKADEFIQKSTKGKQPFFLYYALTAPHSPYVPTKEFIGKSSAGIYGDFVVECDWVVGELMASLKAAGVDKNTLVFMTSDNGPENCTLALKNEHGHYSAGNWRGHKRLNFEGGHRVPTFAVWPGVVRPGSVCDATVSQVDFFATCADMVGHKLRDSEAVDSWSMLPALKGDKNFQRGESVIYQNYLGQLAIRKGEWVMMMHPAWKGMLSKYTDPEEPAVLDAEPFQLYNLKQDPRERTNLFKTYPEKAAELKAQAADMVVKGRSNHGPQQKNDQPYEFMESWDQIEWVK